MGLPFPTESFTAWPVWMMVSNTTSPNSSRTLPSRRRGERAASECFVPRTPMMWMRASTLSRSLAMFLWSRNAPGMEP
ncbi:MAG: hypothetical protein A2V77_17620 [Anaeromyxobacter sp. RBG_16_69_14]|nr:MAG: hypothetical protein A2V77_17620 [Anaeromyxobacter sp. RBG_16_69_14]